MLRAGLTYLLAITIALHGALGCCWHTASAQCSSPAPELTSSEHHCKHHHRHAPSSKPCNCRLECDGLCKAVWPKKTELAKPALWGDWLPVAAFADSISRLSSGELRATSLAIAGLAPPLRAHLLLCVLLI